MSYKVEYILKGAKFNIPLLIKGSKLEAINEELAISKSMTQTKRGEFESTVTSTTDLVDLASPAASKELDQIMTGAKNELAHLLSRSGELRVTKYELDSIINPLRRKLEQLVTKIELRAKTSFDEMK